VEKVESVARFRRAAREGPADPHAGSIAMPPIADVSHI